MAEIGRNAACPCGSGLKYKRCCAGREPGSSFFSRVALSLVAIMLIGGAVFLLTSLDEHDGRVGPTRVWSEAHGHWH
jgi:hypothetical protein